MSPARLGDIARRFGLPLVVLLLAGAYAQISGPFRAPDEFNHFFRAYHVSEGNVLARTYPGGVCGAPLPESLKEMAEISAGYPGAPRKAADPAALARAGSIALDPGRRSLAHFPNSALYSPLVYLPAASAIVAGRTFDAGPLELLHLARFANVLVAALLLALAMGRMPYARDFLAVVALLPMTLFQIGAVTADAMTFPLAFLWIALALDFVRPGRTLPTSVETWTLLVAAMLLGQLRPPFPLLVLLVVEPGVWRRAYDARRRLAGIAAVACATASAVIWLLSSRHLVVPMIPNVATDPAAQLDFVLHHPVEFLKVIFHNLETNGADYYRQMVGVVGWLDTVLPSAVYVLAGCSLLAATMLEPQPVDRAIRLTAVLIFGSGAFLILLAIYQICSPVGGATLDSVQGRYLIPLLPLIGVALANDLMQPAAARPVVRGPILLVICYANATAFIALTR